MSKYEPFNLTDCTYKTVDDHQINLTILTPKTLKPAKYPIIIRIHGGFLVTGTRLLPDWFPNWVLDLALATPAIIITPDYRLLPESAGADILSDMRSLYTWLHTALPFTLSSLTTPLEADLSRILVTGESAGGYLAVQSALLRMDPGIRAVVSAYGVLDIKVPWFTQAFEKVIAGVKMTGPGVLDKHLAGVRGGVTPGMVSEAVPPERVELMVHIIQYGLYANVLGQESECYPMENLERVGDEGLPAMWCFHGKQDLIVPVEGTVAFVERVKSVLPRAEVKLSLVEGDHGVGNEDGLETPWIVEGLAFVRRAWLGGQARI